MSEYKNLCTWLKNNSSGVYRQCFDAAYIIECMEGAQIIQDETIKSLQQQNTALQQQVKDLQAENEEWESLHSNSLYGTMGELKAAAIREAITFIIASPLGDEGECLISIFEQFANTLSSKGGD